jgi:uncharacterized RDD family membrane protein YckC
MICSQCGTLNDNEREGCVRCSKALHPVNMKGKIACAVHANREATTSCAACGMRLCAACAVNANGVDFCENCAPQTAVRHDYDEDYERIPVVDPATAVRAGFGRRSLAFAIDLGIILGCAILLGIMVYAFSGKIAFFLSPTGGGASFYLFWLTVLLVGLTYSAILTSMTGQTLGKQVAGVIVLEPDGHILNLQQSAMRSLAAVVSALFLGVGFFWAIWDPNCETWHDKFSGTTAFLWEEIA